MEFEERGSEAGSKNNEKKWPGVSPWDGLYKHGKAERRIMK
jgi:hypothetical protein